MQTDKQFLEDLNAMGSLALEALQADRLDDCGRELKGLLDAVREAIAQAEGEETT